MRFVTFTKKDGTVHTGLISKDGSRVIPAAALGLDYKDMNDLIERATDSEWAVMFKAQSEAGIGLNIGEVKLNAPIMYPRQDVICLGVNYREHAEEAAAYEKEAFDLKAQYPVYFSKRVNRAAADKEAVPAYEGLVSSLDYEVELAVIIGREAKNVKKGESLTYIFGYTILNDMSARDLQTRHKQWYFGKSLDGFTPMGPWIVTADEIPYPPKLSIQSYVNGELRQSSNTSQLIFNIDDVICELSRGMTLRPGTIISMGTPEGVGMGFNPPKFLKPGDVVECVVEKIGTLRNNIAAGRNDKI